MQMTTLGNTGLKVSRLGFGFNGIGKDMTLSDVAVVARVLNAALDGGINFLDTAAGYGVSEELIGRAIAHRRHEYVLATKCGQVTGGYAGTPWTAQTVKDSIDRSLTRMRTDCIDVMQLHSCDLATLERGEVIEALLEAKQAGKTRAVGYSGDNEAAIWAVESGFFDTLQTSFNLVDQQARTTLFQLVEDRGIGVIAKRPNANGVWGAEFSDRPYTDEYFRRAQLMAKKGPLPDAPDDPILLAIGFIFAHPEVDTAILGTRDPSHVLANVQMVEKGIPISAKSVEEVRRRFDELGNEWVQLE